jgi:hypothetical protein
MPTVRQHLTSLCRCQRTSPLASAHRRTQGFRSCIHLYVASPHCAVIHVGPVQALLAMIVQDRSNILDVSELVIECGLAHGRRQTQ